MYPYPDFKDKWGLRKDINGYNIKAQYELAWLYTIIYKCMICESLITKNY